jgi:hypothetical protein
MTNLPGKENVTRRLQAMKRPATISVGIRKVVMSVLSPGCA